MHPTQTIHKHIQNIPKGKPFTTTKLLGSGKRAAVDQAAKIEKARKIVGDGPTFFVPLEGVKFSMPASELTKTAYNVKLTQKGKALVTAWKEGNLDQLSSALGDVSGDETEATGNK